jgi:hypothetical protein
VRVQRSISLPYDLPMRKQQLLEDIIVDLDEEQIPALRIKLLNKFLRDYIFLSPYEEKSHIIGRWLLLIISNRYNLTLSRFEVFKNIGSAIYEKDAMALLVAKEAYFRTYE